MHECNKGLNSMFQLARLNHLSFSLHKNKLYHACQIWRRLTLLSPNYTFSIRMHPVSTHSLSPQQACTEAGRQAGRHTHRQVESWVQACRFGEVCSTCDCHPTAHRHKHTTGIRKRKESSNLHCTEDDREMGIPTNKQPAEILYFKARLFDMNHDSDKHTVCTIPMQRVFDHLRVQKKLGQSDMYVSSYSVVVRWQSYFSASL